MPIALILLIACSAPGTDKRAQPGDTAGDEAIETPWPDWAWTHWVWEDESTQASALALVDGYLDRDIPVGAVIIDSPWATGYNTFEWNESDYPDPQVLVDDLHERDVRIFVWIVPVINTDQAELYAYAAERDWFMRQDADGTQEMDWWKGEGALIDYFNPEAVSWWHGLVDQVLELDIDGWKCDGADFAALTRPYSPALGEKVERIEYSHAYYRDFHDYTREKLGRDRLNTARPVDNYGADVGGDAVAFAPVDINWAGWVGDQDATFHGLRMALRNMYWSADYGYLAFGSDIGGYRDEDVENGLGREAELLVRWAQVGAFNPVMENGGGGYHEPWLFDEHADISVTDTYRDLVRLHLALLPYLSEAGVVAFEEGRSLMEFQSDESYSYLLGPDLFVAPVLAEGGQVDVVFPEGEWTWLYGDHAVYEGSASFTLALDEFTAFAREGSEIEATLLAL